MTNNKAIWLLSCLFLLGCGMQPATGTTAGGARTATAKTTPEFDSKPFEEAAGCVADFDPLFETQPPGYYVQLVPGDTQAKADDIANRWAPDAKQVYLAWGFWKISMLAQTQHFYYSPGKKKKLIVTFRLVSWQQTVKEENSPALDLGNKILKGVADVQSLTARSAHQRAKAHGYVPVGANDIGVLIHPLAIGPVWVWLDNEHHHYPLLAVEADSGNVIRNGSKMAAIRLLFAF
ncbi:MAG: hypothetical protein HY692_06535 [Cyanobacteria bacterium NC_groundwater_1444_Ag_S-0.65um_54_12]|nr:hypothetical protein [Cyanobacteria bacterium NC_groundwater_1444_Ag_S-0.65um_54_12]